MDINSILSDDAYTDAQKDFFLKRYKEEQLLRMLDVPLYTLKTKKASKNQEASLKYTKEKKFEPVLSELPPT